MDPPPDPPLYNQEEKLPPLVPLEDEVPLLMQWDGDVLPIVSQDPVMLPTVNNFQDFEKAIKMLANSEVQLVFNSSLLEFVKSKKMSLQQLLFYKHQIKKPFLNELIQVKIEAFKKLKNKSSVSWAKDTCAFTVKNYTAEELKLARRAGCPWNKELPNLAAKLGKLDCLKYAIENHCKFDKEDLLAYAGIGGSLDCVKYCLEAGCEMKPNFYLDVVYNNHLHLVQFAHSLGCSFPEQLSVLAALNESPDILAYLVNNECFIDQKAFEVASPACSLYLHSVPDFTRTMCVKVTRHR